MNSKCQDQTEPKSRGQVFWIILNATSSKQTNLQVCNIEKVENLSFLLHVIAGVRHYKKKAGWKSTKNICQ